ncbi:linolenate hydroperoxide lyase, chloroplastic [Iris pallida]|uniref:Linolenate hydroperoxide lyase, chloroplastic n=1 Tax=Iris pallida TaxID=29817 RepID=A0AAX6DN41_IRIPA|nr:linolenate hydroperoxide lyase, chloroplastic [Iris pallida]
MSWTTMTTTMMMPPPSAAAARSAPPTRPIPGRPARLLLVPRPRGLLPEPDRVPQEHRLPREHAPDLPLLRRRRPPRHLPPRLRLLLLPLRPLRRREEGRPHRGLHAQPPLHRQHQGRRLPGPLRAPARPRQELLPRPPQAQRRRLGLRVPRRPRRHALRGRGGGLREGELQLHPPPAEVHLPVPLQDHRRRGPLRLPGRRGPGLRHARQVARAAAAPHRQARGHPPAARGAPRALLPPPLLPRRRGLPQALRVRRGAGPRRDRAGPDGVRPDRGGRRPQHPLRPRLQRVRRLLGLPPVPRRRGRRRGPGGPEGQAEGGGPRGARRRRPLGGAGVRGGEGDGAGAVDRLRGAADEAAGAAAVREGEGRLLAGLARVELPGAEGGAAVRVPAAGDEGPGGVRGPRRVRGRQVQGRRGAAQVPLLVERARDGDADRREQAVRGQGPRRGDRVPHGGAHLRQVRRLRVRRFLGRDCEARPPGKGGGRSWKRKRKQEQDDVFDHQWLVQVFSSSLIFIFPNLSN